MQARHVGPARGIRRHRFWRIAKKIRATPVSMSCRVGRAAGAGPPAWQATPGSVPASHEPRKPPASAAGVCREMHYEWLETDGDYAAAFDAARDQAAQIRVELEDLDECDGGWYLTRTASTLAASGRCPTMTVEQEWT